MFDQEKINAVRERAAAENWSYPYLFNSLKAMGIERYEVDVLAGRTTYVGGGGSLLEPAADDTVPRSEGQKFDVDGLKAAIGRSQRKEITYPQFLAEIASAGVIFYRVDMRPRTVTYHGRDKRMKHVEPVPQTIEK